MPIRGGSGYTWPFFGKFGAAAALYFVLCCMKLLLCMGLGDLNAKSAKHLASRDTLAAAAVEEFKQSGELEL